MTPKPVMTFPEVCAALQLSRQTVYQMLRRGVIPSIPRKPGGKYIVARRAFEKWLEGGVRETVVQ